MLFEPHKIKKMQGQGTRKYSADNFLQIYMNLAVISKILSSRIFQGPGWA
jgi:hypothetical protein